MSYADFVAAERRAAILGFLLEADGTANERSLLSALKATQFPRLTATQLRTDLDELRRKGCVTHEWLHDDLLIAELTARGQDCARGDIEIAGIARPERIR